MSDTKKSSSEQTMKKIDKYQFSSKNLIGSGSYARVFKGEDRETGQEVAIKMIDRKKISQEDYLMNGLLQEIQIMKQLDSDYIVKLIDVLETKNNYYIVQEYCDQGDFRHYLKANGALPESEAKLIMVDILNGFLELLKHGVIHRDLKPENILISTKNKKTGERIFKLADFGFSRTVDNFRRQLLKSLVGTPLYMSPQILMYEKYTSKSDIWSIGLTFYEMLYGRMPWTADCQYQLLEMIMTRPIQWITDKPLSEDAINFMYKCLQVEEVKRIQWDEMYAHSLFGNHFAHFLEVKKNLENKSLYLINNLRQKIHSTNTDLMELFSHFDLTNDSKLDIKGFEQLMKQIDNDLNREEIEHIFNIFDSDGDNRISFTEFQKWLELNNICLSINNSQHIRRKMIDQQLDEEVKQLLQEQQKQMQEQKKNEPDQEISQNVFLNESHQKQPLVNQADLKVDHVRNEEKKHTNQLPENGDVPHIKRKLSKEEKAIFAIGKLRLTINQHQIDQQELFNRYDKNQTDAMHLPEFTRMIMKIDDKLQEDEINIAFKKFDIQKTGKISFQQFKSTIQSIGSSVVIQVIQKQKQKPLTNKIVMTDIKEDYESFGSNSDKDTKDSQSNKENKNKS